MIPDASETMRLRCLAQLYDDWHGCYVLRRLIMGQWVDVGPLTCDEAVKMNHLAQDESLLIVWNIS